MPCRWPALLLQDDRIVFLANVWLDRPDTFEALHTLLSGTWRGRHCWRYLYRQIQERKAAVCTSSICLLFLSP
jgi:hypothetical protein